MAGAGPGRRSRRWREAPTPQVAAAAEAGPEERRDSAGLPEPEPEGGGRNAGGQGQGPGGLGEAGAGAAEQQANFLRRLRIRAAKSAGVAPEDWRDWGGRLGAGLPAEVLAKVAETLVAQNEAAWAARLKRRGWSEEEIQEEMERRKREGNCLFVFARVCKEWRQARLKVGDPLRTRVESDVILPGSVALAEWALAEGCPRERNMWYTMAHAAARYGQAELVKWLCGEGGFEMDEGVMNCAAGSGNTELVQWLRGAGCPWDYGTCYWAVDNGHVEMLRWARENGCPWIAETRDRAAQKLGYTDDFGNVM